MNDSISEKIKKYRKLQNMSQEQLSQISGINISTIKKYECGFRNPKPDQLKKIANALNVSMNSFIFNDIETVSDVLSLLINLDEQTELIINGSKDSFGKYIPSTITFTFDNVKINEAISIYLSYKEKNNSINRSDTNSSLPILSNQSEYDIEHQLNKLLTSNTKI